MLANPVIVVAGDGQSAMAAIDVVVTACLAMGEEDCRRIACGGRYDLGFARDGAGWRINRRFLHIRYRHGEALG